jgi:hypothetical protein
MNKNRNEDEREPEPFKEIIKYTFSGNFFL